MNIAIAGCGIAGSAAAALLARDGHSITVLEQAAQCQGVGAGIMLQPSGQRVLETIGIAETIQVASARLLGLDADLQSGSPLVRLRYDSLSPDLFAWGVHRGHLFDCLLQQCAQAGVTMTNSARVMGYHVDLEGVFVHLASGEQVGPFDFVIATDGSRSKLRQSSGVPCKTVEYPYAALWTTGPCDAVTDRLYQVIDGTDKLVGLLPIGLGQCSFFWGLHRDTHGPLMVGRLDRWKNDVRAMCPAAEQVLDSIDSFKQLTFASYRHVSMKRMHADRIVFLGDAAHPSSPHLGQGVNLALEDVVCFNDALRQTGEFGAACKRYQRQRQRKIRYYQTLTRILTPFFQSGSRVLGMGRNVALPWFPRIRPIRNRMLKTLCGQQQGWL